MNRSPLLRRAVAVLGAAGLVAPTQGALPFPEYFKQRWRGPVVRVRNIEGVSERIRDGKLYLRLKDFLVLVLKNNTEIQMTRLDVLTAADAMTDPQLEHRGFLVDVPLGSFTARLPGFPVRSGRDLVAIAGRPPRVGEHTDLVLRTELGLDDAALARLHELGVIAGVGDAGP